MIYTYWKMDRPVREDGMSYLSLRGSNLKHDPNNDGLYWFKLECLERNIEDDPHFGNFSFQQD